MVTLFLCNIYGFQKTNSGDLVTTSSVAYQNAKSKIRKNYKLDNASINKHLGTELINPEPVFFCSIEPPSLSAQSALEQALIELQREDASLRVSQNTDTGQTVLAGAFTYTSNHVHLFTFFNLNIN